MKTYKLIKTYPGSPAIGTVVNTTNDRVCNYDGTVYYVADFSEFWQLQPEKEYRILSHYNEPYGNKVIFTFCEDGSCLSRTDSHSPSSTVKLSEGTFKIYSVKRLSDGEVFTIGDFCNGAPIDKIWFCDPGYIRFSASINGGYCLDLKSMEHQVFFSFTTEDGVVLRDKGDKVFGVLPKAQWQTNYYGGEGIPIERVLCSKTGELRATAWKWFSTKQAAEDYYGNSKPMFSWTDLFCAFGTLTGNEITALKKIKTK